MTLKGIPNVRFLAFKLHRDLRSRVTYIAYGLPAANKFKVFTIPKKNGGVRTICAPSGALLELQRAVKILLESDFNPRSYVHGFVSKKGRSIVSNAGQHVAKKWVLNIDLENYFGSIHFGRIAGRLQAKPYGYTEEISKLVAHIACYPCQTTVDGIPRETSVLMPGGALSPVLANIVSDKLDGELSRLCKQLGCSYTRYADDISISSNRNKFPGKIARLEDPDNHYGTVLSDQLLDIIEANGFSVNHSKTRLQQRSISQQVTGLVVNNKVNVPRTFIRQVRAMLHDWEINGYATAQLNHFDKYRADKGRILKYEAKNFQWVVRGKIEFIKQVKGATDQVFQKLAERYNALTTGKKILIPVVETNKVIEEAVWYLENENDTISVGTCFVLEGPQFVTCSHCIGPNLTVAPKRAPKFPTEAKLLKDDAKNDLAVITVDSLLPGHMPKAFLKLATIEEVTALRVGDKVQLAGFPGNMNADAVTISEASIVRFSKTTFDKSLPLSNNVMVLDGGTLAGMSGGPVLYNGKVVGIIVRGPNSDDPTAKCEAVLSNHLGSLLA